MLLEEMMLQELQELDIDEADDDDDMGDAFEQSFTDFDDPWKMQEPSLFKVNCDVIAWKEKSSTWSVKEIPFAYVSLLLESSPLSNSIQK